MKTFYIASKLHHAPKWRELYRNLPENFHMESRWPFVEASTSESDKDKYEYAVHFWIDDIKDVKNSDFLILYVEEKDKINGALIEVGAALASNIPVFIVGKNSQLKTWTKHPLIKKLNTIEDVFNSNYIDLPKD